MYFCFSHFREFVQKINPPQTYRIQVFARSVGRRQAAAPHAFIHVFAKHAIFYVQTPSLATPPRHILRLGDADRNASVIALL